MKRLVVLVAFCVGCQKPVESGKEDGRATKEGATVSITPPPPKDSPPVAPAPKPADPPKADPTETITYKELLAVLRKGEKGDGGIYMAPAGSGQVFSFGTEQGDATTAALVLTDQQYLMEGVVLVERHGSVEGARHSADRKEKGILAYGFFTFRANEKSLDLLDKVKKKLDAGLR